ncbi:hypothetical protein [Goodfellowiella coeruleoviolacea]|uniref:Secreted protein n=1 Tax=Goodfellowiella coeruleoviolacea TaxID=334858 RepID=A0AAE3GC94_9PSEU|nr:hypothetical protein [Goodfellowiella coeruleoviolacea]MCP2165617.1 hypothetical protein [Goodfellowiella coeruleoviolacea]
MLKKAFTVAAAVAGLSLVGAPAFAQGADISEGTFSEQNDNITVAFVTNTVVTNNTNVGEGNNLGTANASNNTDDSFNTAGIGNDGGVDTDVVTFGEWAK